MEYEINVARPALPKDKWIYGSGTTYVHYFKVIVPYGKVKEVYLRLNEKFPDCKIEVTVWQKVGEKIDMDKCEF